MLGHLNTAAKNAGINPATLATIASLETLSGSSDPTNEYCNTCYSYGFGVYQVGYETFSDWNAYQGNIYTGCSSICGTNYPSNLDSCAQFLAAVFNRLSALGFTNSTQMMAMAATAWNGCACGYTYSCYPWPGQRSYLIPSSSQLTQYGASAGCLFNNSGYVGNGVFDTSITLV